MTHSSTLKINFEIAIITILFSFILHINTPAQEIIWKKNFGGNGTEEFASITTVQGGTVSVGYAYEGAFGASDWEGITGKGGIDATIVKHDHNGNIVWRKNFGGSSTDRYYSVTTVTDGVIAVGYSNTNSFGNGDWKGIEAKGFYGDAIIVKYDNNGNVVWKKNFGGCGQDFFNAVTALPDGFVAVGEGYNTFGEGDWEGFEGRGGTDAIIVKFDHNGNVVWKNIFGGIDIDQYYSVTTVSDGIVAVGHSSVHSLNTGDWIGITRRGGAIIVKYDTDGNIILKKNFGGSAIGGDTFYSVTTVSDGIVAVGCTGYPDFNSGDWTGVIGFGDTDGIIVKFNNTDSIIWKRNFGGEGVDRFKAILGCEDGVIAVGNSYPNSFGNGMLENMIGKGGVDAIIVKYNKLGNVVWKKNFGGKSSDFYWGVTATSNSIVAVGTSSRDSFGNGDWTGIASNGTRGIIIKYSNSSVGITEPEQKLNEIKVFPNPTTGQLRITNYELREGYIEIFDIYGRIVGANRIRLVCSETVIDISHLQAGIYFLRIGGKTVKIVKL